MVATSDLNGHEVPWTYKDFFIPLSGNSHVFCCRKVNEFDFGVLSQAPRGHLYITLCILYYLPKILKVLNSKTHQSPWDCGSVWQGDSTQGSWGCLTGVIILMDYGIESTWVRGEVSMWGEEWGCSKGDRINGLLIFVRLKSYWSLSARKTGWGLFQLGF